MDDINKIEPEQIDLTATIPRVRYFKIGNNSYGLQYNFRAILRLEEIYGTLSDALGALYDYGESIEQKVRKYDALIDFIFCGLIDRDDTKKTDIEKMVYASNIYAIHEIVECAIMDSVGIQTGGDEPGEEKGGTTGT